MPQRKSAASRGRRARKPDTGEPEFPVSDNTAYFVRDLFRQQVKLLRELLRPHGVSLGSYLYLRTLFRKDGITQREIGRRIGVNDASSRTALEALEKQGLVRRERMEQDMRKMGVFLTPAGKALKKPVLAAAAQTNATCLKDFSASEEAQFRAFLLRAQKSVSAALAAHRNRK